MSFKDKPLKKIVSDNRVTIDVLHNNLIEEFNNDNNKINILKTELEECISFYNETKCEKTLKLFNEKIRGEGTPSNSNQNDSKLKMLEKF